MSVDPKLQDWNPYAYCGGNSINFIDPNGEIWGWIIGAAIGATIGGVYGYNNDRGNWGWYALGGALAGGIVGGAIEEALAPNPLAGNTGYTGPTTTAGQAANQNALLNTMGPPNPGPWVGVPNVNPNYWGSLPVGSGMLSAAQTNIVNEVTAALNIAQSAYNIAQSFLGQDAYAGRCNDWVREVYSRAGGQLDPNYANDFENDPHLFETTNPTQGDIVQFDRGTGQLPHGHVAIYNGNGQMTTTTRTTIRNFNVNAEQFGIRGNPTLRYLMYR